jgi:hypothetical protein
MKKNKKYRKDLVDAACTGIVIGVWITLFALKSFVDRREKDKLKKAA